MEKIFNQIEAWLIKHDEDRRPLSKKERALITKWNDDPNTKEEHKTAERFARAISLMR